MRDIWDNKDVGSNTAKCILASAFISISADEMLTHEKRIFHISPTGNGGHFLPAMRNVVMTDYKILTLWRLAKGFDIYIAPRTSGDKQGANVQGDEVSVGLYLNAVKRHFDDREVCFDGSFIYFN